MNQEQRGRPSAEAGTGQQELNDIARALADATREMDKQHDDPLAMLQAVADASVLTIPGAEAASVTEARRRQELVVRVATSELAQQVGSSQDELGEGPCLDAAYDRITVRVADLATDPRWPRLAARAAELGVHGALSVQLYVDGDEMGSLNLYSTQAAVFDDEAESVALIFAVHAAVAAAGADRTEHLRRALSHRDIIGQAKGILMERHKIDSDLAFTILVKASQRANVKLHTVAEELTRTGAMD